MTVINEKFSVNTKGNTDIIDITQKVKNAVYTHSLQNAVVHVYVAGSTVSITNIEFEPGLLVDLPEALYKIAPTDTDYHHDATWHVMWPAWAMACSSRLKNFKIFCVYWPTGTSLLPMTRRIEPSFNFPAISAKF